MTQKTKSRNAEHVRLSTQFRFVGHCVCINTFYFLRTMNHKRLECIKVTWMVSGLGPRNRVQHLPYNRTPLSDIQQFVQFVLRYAEENAILLPGRIPGYKCDDVQLLPSSTTKHNMGVILLHCLGVGRGTCSLLLSLLSAVATAHSTSRCD